MNAGHLVLAYMPPYFAALYPVSPESFRDILLRASNLCFFSFFLCLDACKPSAKAEHRLNFEAQIKDVPENIVSHYRSRRHWMQHLPL